MRNRRAAICASTRLAASAHPAARLGADLAVQQKGAAPARTHVRLFTVPAMHHCRGTGPYQFDTLSALEAWSAINPDTRGKHRAHAPGDPITMI